MAGLDAQLLAYKAIADVLAADAEWSAAVKLGNRIRLDEDKGELDPFNFATTDNDYPRMSLMPSSGEENLFTATETFGTWDRTDPCPDTIEEGSFSYLLELTTQYLNENERSNIDFLTRRAFIKAGPRLGTTFITGVSLRWETERTDQQESGEYRLRTRMTITVKAEVLTSALIGE